MKGKLGTIIGLLGVYASIFGLAAIANKRNNDAFEAQMECIGLEAQLYNANLNNDLKDAEIEVLKAEIEELKK